MELIEMKAMNILISLFLPQTRGACLSHFRKMLQLTQFDISSTIGINRTIISKMENGEINVSETVWNHILHLVHKESDVIQTIPFIEFRKTLEQCIKNDGMSGGQPVWKERKLS
jgi:DNA-binding XRE family transcriptional regulator